MYCSWYGVTVELFSLLLSQNLNLGCFLILLTGAWTLVCYLVPLFWLWPQGRGNLFWIVSDQNLHPFHSSVQASVLCWEYQAQASNPCSIPSLCSSPAVQTCTWVPIYPLHPVQCGISGVPPISVESQLTTVGCSSQQPFLLCVILPCITINKAFPIPFLLAAPLICNVVILFFLRGSLALFYCSLVKSGIFTLPFSCPYCLNYFKYPWNWVHNHCFFHALILHIYLNILLIQKRFECLVCISKT